MIHRVKITEPFFTDVRTGAKTFEIRKNDRNYMVGDMIELMRFVDGELTGESVYVDIVYMIDDYAGLANGFCVMGIKRMPEPHVPEDEELERRNTRTPRFSDGEMEAIRRIYEEYDGGCSLCEGCDNEKNIKFREQGEISRDNSLHVNQDIPKHHRGERRMQLFDSNLQQVKYQF